MPQLRVFSPAEQADIVHRYRNGEGAQSIAADYGCGTGKPVVRILKLHGAFVENRRWHGQFSHAARADIVRRYNAGETQSEIAESLGCTRTNVRALLVRQGAFIRPMGNEAIDPRSEAILRRMRIEGHSIEVIAKHLSVPRYRVMQWVKALNLPRPTTRLFVKRDPGKGPRGYRVSYVELDDPMRVMAHAEGSILTHRLVMARSLGRPLTRYESVHHINGDRSDNRLENLQLRSGSHGAGAAFVCQDCGSHNVVATPLKEA
jgi:uncharacterized protein (DUF433 family)